MVNPAMISGAERVARRGAGRAGYIERQRQLSPEGRREESVFDVMGHTVDGATSGEYNPFRGDTGAALYDSFHSDFHDISMDQMVEAADMQRGSIARQFELLTGLGAPPGPGEKAPTGFLGNLGATFQLLTSIEQLISIPMGMIPFPALPAIRVGDLDVGLPHAHNHPPNLTPPNPVPVPLPSIGPIIPIPLLSGANKTVINGMPAARCGDMGAAVWCGGYFPLYEVFLGSANVWVEGARAGRVLCDITKHCTFSSRKSMDMPLGCAIGTTISSSGNVLIGGFPMPSLLNIAMGLAMKALFKGVGKVIQRLRGAADEVDDLARIADELAEVTDDAADDAARFVDDLEASGAVRIADDVDDVLDAAIFRAHAREDLRRLASTPTGRQLLDEIRGNHASRGHHMAIEPSPPGPHCAYADGNAARGYPPGSGSSSTVRYNAGQPEPMGGGRPDAPSDVVLAHEAAHARNGQNGQVADSVWDPNSGQWVNNPSPDPAVAPNAEEFNAMGTENAYRNDAGYPPRDYY